MAAFTALAAQAPENITPGQSSSSSGGNSGSGSGGNGGSDSTSPTGTNGGNTPISPSGANGANPAQQSTNAAPVLSSQSFFGLGAAVAAAFAVL